MTRRRLYSEFLGTAFLLLAVVGSGIMGQRLSGENEAIALLANSLATGAALVALILTFREAHFNPVVTLAAADRGDVSWRAVPIILLAQFTGAFLGVAVANILFGLPALSMTVHPRPGWAMFMSEQIATFGLVFMLQRIRAEAAPFAVGCYIMAAYWFTPSTAFANPAATLARAFTDTFAGISLKNVPVFIVGQCVGVALAVLFSPKSVDAVPPRG